LEAEQNEKDISKNIKLELGKLDAKGKGKSKRNK